MRAKYMSSSGRSWTIGCACLLVLLAAHSLRGQTFSVLHAFTGGSEGGGPYGTPLLSNGTLYATTYSGGSPAAHAGTVYEYVVATKLGAYLYQFAGQPYDGSTPMGGLVTDGVGDFYGTTSGGGFTLHGTMYQISNTTEFVIQSFNGQTGSVPEGKLFMDSQGDLWGTTSTGGINNAGTVFEFSAFGTFTSVYSFGNIAGDGIAPASSLVSYRGKLYGTTTEGGKYGWGAIYSINPFNRDEAIVYSFTGRRDGGTPVGGLVADGAGNLWGTTSTGGGRTGAGTGTVFKLSVLTSRLSTVHEFTGEDGSEPLATLVSDGAGDFYGTTYGGGPHNYGTVFKISSAGQLNTLYSFTNGTDGSYPYAGVVMDSAGNLYGTAVSGGQFGWGTLFEIVP